MSGATGAGGAKRPRRIDGSLVFILCFALSGAVACFAVHGSAVFVDTLRHELGLLLRILPLIGGGLLLGAILQTLVPQSAVRRWLGEGSGWRGLVLAAAVGTLVPGGPITSFPLVAAGAEIGVTITFLTSWATLGLNRVIVWEIPFMGGDFAALRYAVSLPLPFIAGFSARWIAKAVRRR